MHKYKVIITARSFGQNDEKPYKILHENGFNTFKIPVDKPLSAKELIPHIIDADVIIVGNDAVTKEVIEAGKQLKMISRYGVGYDNIDLNEAKRREIIVTNTPNTNDNSVADLTFALILSLARHIPAVVDIVRKQGWQRIMGNEVCNKTLGMIGMGKIARAVVQRAKGFDMKIICCDVKPDLKYGKKFGITYCSLEEVCRQSDIISIHTPLLPETKGLIGKKQLEMMKPTALLINTARGGIIDENALFYALREKTIAGAALDVMLKEPPTGSPLLELDNIIITPHIGGYSSEAVNNMGIIAAKNIVSVIRGNKKDAYIV